MPRQIEAWAADDGSVHTSEHAAALHDAKEALKKLGIFNEATIRAVLERKEEIFNALATAIRTMPAPTRLADVAPDAGKAA
jgi:hypothetical protein